MQKYVTNARQLATAFRRHPRSGGELFASARRDPRQRPKKYQPATASPSNSTRASTQ